MTLDEKLKRLGESELPDEAAAERLRERVEKTADAAGAKTDPSARRSQAKDKGARSLRLPAAACLILCFGLGGLLLAREAVSPSAYRWVDSRGETYVFCQNAPASALSLHVEFPTETRALTGGETASLFSGISIRSGDPLANDDLVWRGDSAGGDSAGGDPAGVPNLPGGIANDDLVQRYYVDASGEKISYNKFDSPLVVPLDGTEQPDGPIIQLSAEAEAGSSPVSDRKENADMSGKNDSTDSTDESEEAGRTELPGRDPAEEIAVETGDAAFDLRGTFREDSGELIRAEGHIGETKVVFSAPGFGLTDAAAVRKEDGTAAQIDGHAVTLGSFTTGANSRGERTFILCAYFDLPPTEGNNAGWSVYAEAAGDTGNKATVAETLIGTVKGILASPADFSSIRQNAD